MSEATQVSRTGPSGLRLNGIFVLRASVGLALLVLALLSVATLFAGRAWLPDMLSFFRPHLFYASAALFAVTLAARLRRGAVVAAALLAFNVLPLMVRMTPLPSVATASDDTIRVMSMNLKWDNLRTDLARRAVDETTPDVLVVQEALDLWPGVIALWNEFTYRSFDPGDPTYDVEILSRFPISGLRSVDPPEGLRAEQYRSAIRAQVNPGPRGRPFILYAIHPPTPRSQKGWETRNAYLQFIAEQIRAEPPGVPVVVAGDWNTPVWSPFLRHFVDETHLAPAEPMPWPAATRIFDFFGLARPHWLGTPIDRIVVSRNVGVVNFRLGPYTGSDHLPVYSDLLLR